VAVDIGDEHAIGNAERLGHTRAETRHVRLVAERGSKTAHSRPRIGLTYTLQGDAHRRRMMRKIVEDRDATDHAAHRSAV
jgi:hypothetical protein